MYDKYGVWVEEGWCCTVCGAYFDGLPDNGLEICNECFSIEEREKIENGYLKGELSEEEYNKLKDWYD